MTSRCWFAAIAVLVIYGAAESLKGRGMPTESAHLQLRLDELPRRLGTWTGEDNALDTEIFEAIGAKYAINRTYRDPRGNSVAMHCAVFLQYGVQGLSHSPEVCYPAAGFHIAESRDVFLDSDKQHARPCRLLTLERDGQQIYCLFWYQFGDTVFCDGYAQRRWILGLRGQTTWPPLVKVMLQANAVSSESAERQLKDLARPIFAWAKDFH